MTSLSLTEGLSIFISPTVYLQVVTRDTDMFADDMYSLKKYLCKAYYVLDTKKAKAQYTTSFLNLQFIRINGRR